MTASRAISQHRLIKTVIPRNGDPIELGTVSVLMGPANAGKTEFLRDIVRLGANLEIATDGSLEQEAQRPVILSDLSFTDRLTLDRLIDGLGQLPTDAANEIHIHGIGSDLATSKRCLVTSEVRNLFARPLSSANAIASGPLAELMALRFAYLDPRQRLAIAPTTPCSPLQAPESLLQLLQDSPQGVHDELDRIFSSVFSPLHLRLDESA